MKKTKKTSSNIKKRKAVDVVTESFDLLPVENERQVLQSYFLTFPTGYKPEEDKHCKITVYDDKEEPGLLTFTADTGNTRQFVGINQVKQINKQALIDFHLGSTAQREYIAYLDRSTGVMRYQELKPTRVVTMRPYVEEDEAAKTRTTLDGRAEKLTRVTTTGTAKDSKRVTTGSGAVITASRITGLKAVGQLLEGVAEEAASNKLLRADLPEELGGTRNLPKHNLQAETMEEAYKFSHIFSSHILRAATSHADRLVNSLSNGNMLQELKHTICGPPYILSRMSAVAVSGGSAASSQVQQQRAVKLCVLGGLMGLLRAPRTLLNRQREIQRAAQRLKMPVEMLEEFLPMFYEQVSSPESNYKQWTHPQAKRDLLLSHVVLLALLAEGGSMAADTVKQLSDALDIGEAVVYKHCSELGCVVNTMGPRNKAVTGVQLMPPSDPPKRLVDRLPEIKGIPNKGRR